MAPVNPNDKLGGNWGGEKGEKPGGHEENMQP